MSRSCYQVFYNFYFYEANLNHAFSHADSPSSYTGTSIGTCDGIIGMSCMHYIIIVINIIIVIQMTESISREKYSILYNKASIL